MFTQYRLAQKSILREMFNRINGYRVDQKSILRECSLVLTGMFTVSDSVATVASHSVTPDLISNNNRKFTI